MTLSFPLSSELLLAVSLLVSPERMDAGRVLVHVNDDASWL